MNRRKPRRRRGLNLLMLFTVAAMLLGGSQALLATAASAYQGECAEEDWTLCDEIPGGSDPTNTGSTTPGNQPGETIYVQGDAPDNGTRMPPEAGGYIPGDEGTAPVPSGLLAQASGPGSKQSGNQDVDQAPKRPRFSKQKQAKVLQCFKLDEEEGKLVAKLGKIDPFWEVWLAKNPEKFLKSLKPNDKKTVDAWASLQRQIQKLGCDGISIPD